MNHIFFDKISDLQKDQKNNYSGVLLPQKMKIKVSVDNLQQIIENGKLVCIETNLFDQIIVLHYLESKPNNKEKDFFNCAIIDLEEIMKFTCWKCGQLNYKYPKDLLGWNEKDKSYGCEFCNEDYFIFDELHLSLKKPPNFLGEAATNRYRFWVEKYNKNILDFDEKVRREVSIYLNKNLSYNEIDDLISMTYKHLTNERIIPDYDDLFEYFDLYGRISDYVKFREFNKF